MHTFKYGSTGRRISKKKNYSFFDGFVYSFEEHAIKPDAKIFKSAFKKFNIKPEEGLLIDNDKRNILGAKKIGMHAFYHDDTADDFNKLKLFLLQLGVKY